jgi:hypothetical protein
MSYGDAVNEHLQDAVSSRPDSPIEYKTTRSSAPMAGSQTTLAAFDNGILGNKMLVLGTVRYCHHPAPRTFLGAQKRAS